MPEKDFIKAFKTHPRLKTKVNNFHKQMSSSNNPEEDYVAIRPEWIAGDSGPDSCLQVYYFLGVLCIGSFFGIIF